MYFLYHMLGYADACILPLDFSTTVSEIITQVAHKYAVITMEDPFTAPFTLIPNAYKTLMRFMDVNGLKNKQTKDVLLCFEKEYEKDGITYMDIFISID